MFHLTKLESLIIGLMSMDIKKIKELLFNPFLCSLAIFVVVAMMEKIGYDKFSTPGIEPVSWAVFFKYGLPKAFLISLGFFLSLVFWKVRKKSRGETGDSAQ